MLTFLKVEAQACDLVADLSYILYFIILARQVLWPVREYTRVYNQNILNTNVCGQDQVDKKYRIHIYNPMFLSSGKLKEQ